MTRILIRGGCVLTLGRTNFTEADVLIDGDTIAEVGEGIRARDAEQVDGTGTIVMPGFIDAHRRTRESLFRNAGDQAGSSADEVAARFEPDDLYAATLLGLLSALDVGITTVVDWCDLLDSSDLMEAATRAHAEAGTRSVLVGTVGADAAGSLGSLRSGSTTVAAGVPYPAAGPEAEATWSAARAAGFRLHARAGEPGHRGVAASMSDRLGSDVTLVHCSMFDGGDLDVVASTGTRIVLAPAAEMARGVGAPPVQDLIDRGIRPGLGSDSERMSSGDLFAQMRAVISLQHATVFDRKLAGKAGLPRLLTTREVIKYATVDGAAAAGLEGVTGALEPGMQADVIVLRADRPNIHPINDPIGAVVWGMDTSNVDSVFVAGRAAKRGGELVADVARVRSLAMAARDRVAGTSGILSGAGGRP